MIQAASQWRLEIGSSGEGLKPMLGGARERRCRLSDNVLQTSSDRCTSASEKKFYAVGMVLDHHTLRVYYSRPNLQNFLPHLRHLTVPLTAAWFGPHSLTREENRRFLRCFIMEAARLIHNKHTKLMDELCVSMFILHEIVDRTPALEYLLILLQGMSQIRRRWESGRQKSRWCQAGNRKYTQ